MLPEVTFRGEGIVGERYHLSRKAHYHPEPVSGVGVGQGVGVEIPHPGVRFRGLFQEVAPGVIGDSVVFQVIGEGVGEVGGSGGRSTIYPLAGIRKGPGFF